MLAFALRPTGNRLNTMPDREELTVVVGYDGSESARHALTRSRHWGLRRALLMIVAVTPSAPSPGLHAELTDEQLDAEAALREARELLVSEGETARIDTRIATGDPAEVLMQIVRELDADLLVVGRRGRDFVSRVLLGSVAQRVVQHASCDVLVVS